MKQDHSNNAPHQLDTATHPHPKSIGQMMGLKVSQKMSLTVGAVFTLALMTMAAMPAAALTLKTGEVLASDGSVHFGASPKNKENIMAAAKSRDMPAGMHGSNVFVVVGDSVTFIPATELRGKTEDTVIATVGDKVVQNLTGNDDIKFKDVKAVSEIAESTGVPIEDLVDSNALAALDPEVLKEIEDFSSESGITVENLMAVNQVIEKLPEDQMTEFVSELQEMVDNGFAEQVNDFMNDLREIEGGLNALAQYDSYEACVAGGGGDVCDQVDAAMDEQDI